mgnify:CR=1 FL=1
MAKKSKLLDALKIVHAHHNERTEEGRCKQQATNFMRLMKVHRQLLGSREERPTTEQVRKFAKENGMVERSIYRLMRTMEEIYMLNGSTLLDQ